MSTDCYAQVRGSAIRVTGLDRCGTVMDTVPYAVSKSVASVRINEVTETGSNEIQRNDTEERRLHLVRPAQTIKYTVDIRFTGVDPGLFAIVAGTPMIYKDVYGFGEVPFGEAPFGGSLSEGQIVGFDSDTRLPKASFALEIWSRLANASCGYRGTGFGTGGFGVNGFGTGGADPKRWGYTLFPFLKGGRISGVTFANRLISFSLIGAATQRGSKWGLGPYDVDGEGDLLPTPVTRNTNWRNTLVLGEPPEPTCGLLETVSA